MITTSPRVRAEDFSSSWLVDRAREMDLVRPPEPVKFHRKIWELAIIAEVFMQHVLTPGGRPRCLGFGVGKEPLALWLWRQGADVTATDSPDNNPAWVSTGQHARSLEDLGFRRPETLPAVVFRAVDMNHLPDDLLQGQFDFTWSCGSFEHIGGIQNSVAFFLRQMRALKPGGIACHTTEFNYESLDKGTDFPTINGRDLSLFRHCDLLKLEELIRRQGDEMFPLDLALDSRHPADLAVDSPPYTSDYHLNIRIGNSQFKTTSIALIARRCR